MANRIIIGPVQGPKGDRGPQGLKGDRGPQGETGKVPQSLLDDVLALGRDKFDKTGGTLTGDINIRTTTPTVTFTDSRGLPPVKIGYTKSGDNTFEIGSGVKTLQFGPDGVLRFNKDEVLTANSDAIKNVEKYTDGLATSKTINSFPLSRATEGEVYRVPTTNKYVVCIKNYSGNLISLPNANFEELSVWKNKNKLDNFLEVGKVPWKPGEVKTIRVPFKRKYDTEPSIISTINEINGRPQKPDVFVTRVDTEGFEMTLREGATFLGGQSVFIVFLVIKEFY